MSEALLHDPDELPPWPILTAFALFVTCVSFVILALTAYTYQLDDIKLTGLYVGGAGCLLAWTLLWYRRLVDAPPRRIWIPYACYLVVCFVSTVSSREFVHWVAWQQIGGAISLLGYVLLGMAVVQTKKMAELMLKFWVAMVLATTAFGLVHYMGLLSRLYDFLYPNGPTTGTDRLHDLLLTFKGARSMLSTILNVQFFGNFLLMLLPVTGACSMIVFHNLRRRMAAGQSLRRPITWTIIASLSVILSITCILTTYSKSSIFLLPLSILAFFVGIYLFTTIRRIPYLWLVVVLGGLMAGSIYYVAQGDLREQLTNVEQSLGPRRIIFAGAWNMFRDNPVLGGGPGSFRLLFPSYRSPDYHLARVSNVTYYAHNWVLDLLAETGILGAAAYLAFLGGVFHLGWKALRTCPDMALRVAVIGTLLGVLSVLAGSMTTPMTRWPVGAVALHAMIGSALGITGLSLRAPAARRKGVAARDTWQSQEEGTLLRSVLAGFCAVYLVYITNWSARMFEAAYYHNEGIKKTDLPTSYFSAAGIAEDPVVVRYIQRGIEDFVKSLALDPSRATTYYKLAHAYNRLGDEEKSLQQYINLQKYAPDYSEIHYNLGVIYYNMGMDLKKQGEKEQRAGNDTQAEEILAKAREKMDSSILQFERAAQLSNKVSVWYFRGNTLSTRAQLDAGDSEENRARYTKAGEVFARTSTLPISTVIQEEGQQDREQELRLRSLRLARESYVRAGEFELAAGMAERYLQEMPTSLTVLREAVTLHVKAGFPERALGLLDASLASNPLNPDVGFLKITALRDAGRLEEANQEAKYLLALDGLMRQSNVIFLTEEMRDKARKLIEETPTVGKTNS